MSRRLLDRRAILGAFAGLSGAGAGLLPARAFAKDCKVTNSDVLGPFYIPSAPERTIIAARDEPGDPLTVRGRVLAAGCSTPLRHALLDVWQADANGVYHDQKDDFRLRGQILTDDTGSFEFASIVPGRYKLDAGYRPAHIHFIIGHPQHQPLTTQLYFTGDPYLSPKDGCGDECDSSDPGRIVALTKAASGRGFVADFQVVLRPRRA